MWHSRAKGSLDVERESFSMYPEHTERGGTMLRQYWLKLYNSALANSCETVRQVWTNLLKSVNNCPDSSLFRCWRYNARQILRTGKPKSNTCFRKALEFQKENIEHHESKSMFISLVQILTENRKDCGSTFACFTKQRYHNSSLDIMTYCKTWMRTVIFTSFLKIVLSWCNFVNVTQ